MVENKDIKTGFASPPCYAHELDLYDNGYMGVDAQAALDVARWRKAKRDELTAARMKFSVKDRRVLTEEIAKELTQINQPVPGMIISLYWPMKAELDLRGWMTKWVGQGVRMTPRALAAYRDGVLIHRTAVDAVLARQPERVDA